MEKACFDYLTNKEKKIVYNIIRRSKKRNKKTPKAIVGNRKQLRKLRRRQLGGALPLLPLLAAGLLLASSLVNKLLRA